MKTLLITIDYPPIAGGVARYLAGYAKIKQWNVLAPMNFGAERADGIFRKKLLWGMWPKWLPLLFWTIFYGRKYEEIVISHILPAGFAALLLRKPYTVIIHGLDAIMAAKNPWKKFWARRILDGAKEIVVNSLATGALLEKIFGTVYKFSVQYPRIEPPAAPKENYREKNGLGGKKIILSLGRLVKRKGQEKIIRFLPKILEAVPEAVFIIAGDGPERGELEALAKFFRVSDKVLFLGKVKEDELSDVYAACDIFAAPSLPSKDDWEGFGIVCLEAAYFGKPVVATNVGGLPEAVENGVTGYVVQNDEELLEKIIALLKDEELRNRLGEAGKERVKDKFLISNSPNF